MSKLEAIETEVRNLPREQARELQEFDLQRNELYLITLGHRREVYRF